MRCSCPMCWHSTARRSRTRSSGSPPISGCGRTSARSWISCWSCASRPASRTRLHGLKVGDDKVDQIVEDGARGPDRRRQSGEARPPRRAHHLHARAGGTGVVLLVARMSGAKCGPTPLAIALRSTQATSHSAARAPSASRRRNTPAATATSGGSCAARRASPSAARTW